MKKRIRKNKFGQKLFYPEDKCIYCGERLGPGYHQYTFSDDRPYHCNDWGPTCKEVYEQIQSEKRGLVLRERIIKYREERERPTQDRDILLYLLA